MREISLVKRLKFNFTGSIAKKALVIGDADNDQLNELVCANLQGDLAVFKGSRSNKYAYATQLGMVTACLVGEVFNNGKNCIAAINTEGWLFLFDLQPPAETKLQQVDMSCDQDTLGSPIVVLATPIQDGEKVCSSYRLKMLYDQRMPSNCKELLLADLDGDGQNELIVGLTDRVLRTYKWIKIGADTGKFVGLYKWEFADQIGAVSLNPSRHENCQDIIVAQPGGTYAKLECFDKKPLSLISNSASSASSSGSDEKQQTGSATTASGSDQHYESATTSNESPMSEGDNVRTEYISKLTPEYHQLALAQMRNHHVSTEVLGGIRDSKHSDSYTSVVIATLDGTLMLVNKDQILWSLQVDHQLFAAALLEIGPYRKSSRSPYKLTQSESTSTIVASTSLPKDSDHQQFDHSETDSKCNIDPQETPKDSVDFDLGHSIGPSRDTSPKIEKHHPSSQYFVVCAWNGKTYIIDEERNYLRFKFDEAVSAFTAGIYNFDDQDHTSLVYATFNNQIVLYYDVIVDNIRPMYLVEEVANNPAHLELNEQIVSLAKRLDINYQIASRHTCGPNAEYSIETLDIKEDRDTIGANQPCDHDNNQEYTLRYLLKEILYNIKDSELPM